MEQRWPHEWGNKNMYFSHGASNSRGVAIMSTNNYDAIIVNIRRDIEGRILIIDLERHGTIYTIGNMYAPTRNFERDQQNVFNEFTHYLSHMKNEHTIIGGDFNLYMNPRLDKLDNMPEHHDNRNYREDIISYLEVNNLVDAWRTANPDMKFFTWHRGNKRTRLYYFFSLWPLAKLYRERQHIARRPIRQQPSETNSQIWKRPNKRKGLLEI